MVLAWHFEQSHPRKIKYLMFKMFHECNGGCSGYHYCEKSELTFCAGSHSARCVSGVHAVVHASGNGSCLR